MLPLNEMEARKIMPHIFLPRTLPNSTSDDIIEVESKLLLLMENTVLEFNDSVSGTNIHSVVTLVSNWASLQGVTTLNANNLSETIRSLEPGQMFALYIRAQNAGVIISLHDYYLNEENAVAILSTFPSAQKSTEVIQAPGDLFSVYPASSIQIPKTDLLNSTVLAAQLGILCSKQFDMAMSKSHQTVQEVANPIFISEWLTATLSNSDTKLRPDFPKICKKIRDDVICRNGLVSFRRSGLWMTAKVTLQISLVKELGEIDGTFVYKMIMIKLLLHFFKPEWKYDFCIDLSLEMIGKIARRIYKLQDYFEKYKPTVDSEFYQMLLKNGTSDIRRVRETLEVCWKSIMKEDSDRAYFEPLESLDFRCDTVHYIKHSSSYLNPLNTTVSERIQQAIPDPKCPRRHLPPTSIPTFSSFTSLDQEVGRGMFIGDIETWISTNLHKITTVALCQQILSLLVDYAEQAIIYYANDPLGGSRMVLTSLKIIQVLDKLATTKYPLLKEHRVGVQFSIIQDLLLPMRSDLEMAYELEAYFRRRNTGSVHPSLIDEDSISQRSFSVRFANVNSEMRALKTTILKLDERMALNKVEELKKERKEIARIRCLFESLSCEYNTVTHQTKQKDGSIVEYKQQYHSPVCQKCLLDKQDKATGVSVCERIFREDEDSQNAVVFELLIPTEIATLRDALYIFQSRICSVTLNRQSNIYGLWKNDGIISQYSRGDQKYIHLGSTTAHHLPYYHYYGDNTNKHPDYPDDNFILHNGYNCHYVGEGDYKITPTQSDVKRFSTFHTIETSEYQNLQWAINATSHTENQVIARQAECNKNLSLIEFKEFCSLRAGHRLQLRNMIRALTLRTLSIQNESVFHLICQAVWQGGPLISVKENPWCREAHEDLLDQLFASKMVDLLSTILERYSKNWKESCTLMTIIVLANRIFSLTVCSIIANKALIVLKHCRRIASLWCVEIEKVLAMTIAKEHEVSNMRVKLIKAAVCSALTFNTDSTYATSIMNDQQDILYWLKSIARIHDYMLLANSEVELRTTFLRNLFRWVRHIGLSLEPWLHEMLENDKTGLNEFVIDHWNDAELQSIGTWSSHQTPSEQVYYCTFKGKPLERWLQIDIIRGGFLIDGAPVGRLPLCIVQHADFKNVFGNTIFQVQPATSNAGALVTTFKYSGCTYSFYIQNHQLFVTEQQGNWKEFQLFPARFWGQDIPLLLKRDHSHWWNKKENLIEFRPKHFHDKSFHIGSSIKLKFDVNSKILTDISKNQRLVDMNSDNYSKIVKIIERLEHRDFIHVWSNEVNIIIVELPRMGLHFEMAAQHQLKSREYRGMKIAQNQKFGCFIGLQQGLLLDHLDSSTLDAKHIFLLPHGNVDTTPGKNGQHFVVIDNKTLCVPPFFSFEVDYRLQKIRASQGHLGWIFLSYLYAVTSSPLPDLFTGMTGTESAMQLLQSGHCWSCRPLDSITVSILSKISSLSPQRTYYYYTESMQSARAPPNLSSFAAHDGLALIVEKLILDSQRLLFAFGKGVVNLEPPNRTLVEKAYWRRYSTHTNEARISSEFDERYTNLPNIRGASCFRKEDCGISGETVTTVRTIAALCYSRRCNTPSSIKLKSIIRENGNVKGVSLEHFSFQNISDCLTIGLKRSFMDLYKFARKVLVRELWNEWTLLLCTLAFNGIMSSVLYLLQTISLHSELFKDPPPYSDYRDIDECDFDNQRVKIIFIRNAEEPVYIYDIKLSHSEILENNQKIRRLHPQFVDTQASNLANVVQNHWPLNSCDITTFAGVNYSRIKLDAAIITLNSELNKWKKNRELRSFLNSIERTAQTLIGWRTSPRLHNLDITTSKDVTAKYINRQLPRFNFEEILQRQASLFDAANIQSCEDIFKTGRLSIDNNLRLKIGISSLNTEAVPPFPLETKSLCEIGKIYMESLKESWKASYNHSVEESYEDPEIKNINTMLQKYEFYSRQAESLWRKVMEIMFHPEKSDYGIKALYHSELFPRMTPCTLLPLLYKNKRSQLVCIAEQLRTMIGAVAVLWTLQQRESRCIKFAKLGKAMEVALQMELDNLGHEDWSPEEKPEWLLFELEMNLMIRPVQISVAEQMISPQNNKNALMQLNMGEGKTSVIVPLLVISLANGEQMCRLTVLKSLYQTNIYSLIQNIGGLLNRRLYTFPCRRDISINTNQAQLILNTYKECCLKRGIFLTLPEHRLSFKLKGYEKCRSSRIDEATKLLEVQTWLSENARDILDESDEILQAKYQLMYTVGLQLLISGGPLRWQVIQNVLKLVKKHMPDLKRKFGDHFIEFDSNLDYQERFPHCRILKNDSCYSELCNLVASNFLEGKSYLRLPELQTSKKDMVLQFMTEETLDKAVHDEALKLFDKDSLHINILLILRGILAYGVLLLALSKRWRVNYGVNPTGHRLMAVPFRAKDVAAERTEFGHPDVGIILTQLSYYYSGVNDEQLINSFMHLSRMQNVNEIYSRWIAEIPDVHPSIRTYAGVNLSDYDQRTKYLFPVLRKNIAVIDFWLEKCVFPKECKQFPYKMACSAWDLCPDNTKYPVTGFSGTNDSRLLLPLSISQNDLPQLQGTNGHVLRNLLLEENNNYESLPAEVTGRGILNKLSEYKIRLLLDVGALMLELDNKQVVQEWLKLIPPQDIDAAIYFDQSNRLVVRDRLDRVDTFEFSSFRSRLDRCIVYLDDIHTRGTDLKIPSGSQACVTLGTGVTKDKLVQACMRMRMLGQGHTICFWASHEVHNAICTLVNSEGQPYKIGTKDVLQWAIDNSCRVTRDGLVHWCVAGLSYALKKTAQDIFDRGSKAGTEILQFGTMCAESEVIQLMNMYGGFRQKELFSTIVKCRDEGVQEGIKFQLASFNVLISENVDIVNRNFETIGKNMVKQCELYVPTMKRFVNLLDEEQERELEHEFQQERPVLRPGYMEPVIHELHEDVKTFIIHGKMLTSEYIKKLPNALARTTIYSEVERTGWQGNGIYVTKDYRTVVKISGVGDNVDDFVRSPKWVASVSDKTGECNQNSKATFLLLSPFEANELMPIFRAGKAAATLHMFASRIHADQDTLIHHMELSIPSSPIQKVYLNYETLNVHLLVFSGSYYLSDENEQKAYCKVLGLIPRPRTQKNQEDFDNGLIASNGFVKPEFRSCVCQVIENNCEFQANPEPLVVGINSRFGSVPPMSHIGQLVVKSNKPFHANSS